MTPLAMKVPNSCISGLFCNRPVIKLGNARLGKPKICKRQTAYMPFICDLP